ncbi:MAG TPA: AlpA family phage regulatory protein [Rubrivivax sp.]|nr:AlpA family phage regulatory protein [Rubrivivax sp.]
MTMTMTNAVTPPLLRLPQVLALFPVSRSSWYEGVKTGRYPSPVKLGARAVAWRREDLEALLVSLEAADRETMQSLPRRQNLLQ